MTLFDLQVAFQVCSGRHHEDRRSGGRPAPAVSHDSLSSLPPPVPAPAKRSPSRFNTASPLQTSSQISHKESLRINRQANLVLENPGLYTPTNVHLFLHYNLYVYTAFHGMASLASLPDQNSDEKEYKLRVLEPAEDCSSLGSSNRSSIASDTDLMVKDHP